MSWDDKVRSLELHLRYQDKLKLVYHRFYKTTGSFWTIFEVIETGEKFRVEFYRIIKLSGVSQFQIKLKKQYRPLVEEALKHWTYLYKRAERFRGGIFNGHEVGVIVLNLPNEENS